MKAKYRVHDAAMSEFIEAESANEGIRVGCAKRRTRGKKAGERDSQERVAEGGTITAEGNGRITGLEAV